jgi:demethylmenaquinone methyltransferase/2-methoxy-6-polyprenyl-1,4-benzoquinol methylase
MAFATRHIPSVDAFLEEAHRVLRPGGRLILLDMDLGRGRFWGPLYRSYFRKVLPSVAAALTGQGETYRWMVRTVEEGPGPESLVPALRRLGFEGIDVRHPTGGAVYLIVARSGGRGRREDAPASSGASGGGAIVSRSESAVE